MSSIPHFEQARISSIYLTEQDILPSYSPRPINIPVNRSMVCYGTLPLSIPTTSTPVTVQNVDSLGTKSAIIECPHCRNLIWTVLDYEVGLLTFLSVLALFVIGCSKGGHLIPCLFPWTKDIVHNCPVCDEKIATFTRLERDIYTYTDYIL